MLVSGSWQLSHGRLVEAPASTRRPWLSVAVLVTHNFAACVGLPDRSSNYQFSSANQFSWTSHSISHTFQSFLCCRPSRMEQFRPTCSSSRSKQLVFVQAQAQNSSVHFMFYWQTLFLCIVQTFVMHSRSSDEYGEHNNRHLSLSYLLLTYT